MSASNSSAGVDVQLTGLLQQMAKAGVTQAAQGLAGMLGQAVTVTQPVTRLMPLSDVPHVLGGPENEAVGIYLQALGELCGQIMLILPLEKAFELVDLLMDLPPGTTHTLGSLERSALAEVGNITGTFFLNAVSAACGLESRPSPPAVMVDMVGAILDIIVAMSAGVSETVLVIEAAFLRAGREVEAHFWVIPDTATLQALTGDAGTNAR
jgi:chemotaxis protein CheC